MCGIKESLWVLIISIIIAIPIIIGIANLIGVTDDVEKPIIELVEEISIPKYLEVENFIVGEKYLFGTDWNIEDPFESLNCDTVKILATQNGYIKWINLDYIRFLNTPNEDKFIGHGKISKKSKYFREIPKEKTEPDITVTESLDTTIEEEVDDDDYYTVDDDELY